MPREQWKGGVWPSAVRLSLSAMALVQFLCVISERGLMPLSSACSQGFSGSWYGWPYNVCSLWDRLHRDTDDIRAGSMVIALCTLARWACTAELGPSSQISCHASSKLCMS